MGVRLSLPISCCSTGRPASYPENYGASPIESEQDNMIFCLLKREQKQIRRCGSNVLSCSCSFKCKDACISLIRSGREANRGHPTFHVNKYLCTFYSFFLERFCAGFFQPHVRSAEFDNCCSKILLHLFFSDSRWPFQSYGSSEMSYEDGILQIKIHLRRRLPAEFGR